MSNAMTAATDQELQENSARIQELLKTAQEQADKIDRQKKKNKTDNDQLEILKSQKEELVKRVESLEGQLDHKEWELSYRDRATLRKEFQIVSGGPMRMSEEQLRGLCKRLAVGNSYSDEKYKKLARFLSHKDEQGGVGFEAFYAWLKSRDSTKRSRSFRQ